MVQQMLLEQQKILARREFQRKIACEFCEAELKPKNVTRHMLKVHGVKPGMTLGEMTKSQRRKRLSSLFRPDKEQRKEYLYKDTFVSGGGFGMGKNRKH